MTSAGARTIVEVDGRQLSLSNLGKVLYPRDGVTKAEVIDYYRQIAPVLLPHLAGRPVTLKRYPDGVDGQAFFTKNAAKHRPDWVRTVTLPSPGSTKNRDTIDYLLVEDLPTLVWIANLAALELHTPMWTVPSGMPNLIVADLDPGPPATIVECCRVAELLREAMGMPLCPKTSGSKGLQVYAPVTDGRTADETRADMRVIAARLEREHPDLVVSNMRKELRPGKVLIDWSQNNAAKTTVSVYSLRARDRPTVSTPVTWDEVAACTHPGDLIFTAGDVLKRVADQGDLSAALLTPPAA